MGINKKNNFCTVVCNNYIADDYDISCNLAATDSFWIIDIK